VESTLIRRRRWHAPALLIAVIAAGAAALAAWLWQSGPAGKLVRITEFGDNPTGLEMHLYVPPRLPERPAVVLALHWCTGSGPDFHANTGLSQLADANGFLVIFPSATREGHCWDVHSPAALAHGGGSDPLALLAMIDHVITNHRADAARVFVTGHSSGGMMTQLLLAVYPDVFRAGAASAGVPFGCFAGPTEWNEDCALGKVTRSPREWGDLVRGAYPTFSGPRPPLQLWHGTADDALDFHNFGESIKQWTDVLQTLADPVATDHGTPALPWTRLRYADTQGEVRLEAFRGAGVPHNFPLPAAEIIDFFGLVATERETARLRQALSRDHPPQLAQCLFVAVDW
jgi:acetylxylan esterase